jgi:DNA invertase Pin-like site-specific DNA recombinase
VSGEYVDNDVSAYSGKRRPDYERMLADLADGTVDAVLVYHIDRLTRRPIELEDFLSAVDRAKVRHVKFVTGDTDVHTGDGLLMARIMGAVAANESASKSRRVRRKMEQVAAEGRPHGGSQRPYGYAADKITVVAEEAAIIRTLVARFLAGESSRSLASWLEAQELSTVSGKPWRTGTLKAILISARIAGLRTHRGQVVGPAVWDAIITEDEHRRVLATYAQKKVSGRRTPQRYLLSGMLRCGKCGSTLYSSAREHTRRYVCISGPDHEGGCGRLTVVADPLERLIADAVLYRLDTPELADALAGRNSADHRTQELSAIVDQAQEQLEELAAAHGAQQFTMREWMKAREPVEQRQRAAQRQLAALTRTDALTGLVGHGEALRASWSTLNLSRQHTISKALIEHVSIGPGQPGVRSFDRDRVNVMWRL